jgi:hypothetical protein
MQAATIGVPQEALCDMITCPYHQHRLGLPPSVGELTASARADPHKFLASQADTQEEVLAMATAAANAAKSTTPQTALKKRAAWSPLAQRYLDKPPIAAVLKAKPKLTVVSSAEVEAKVGRGERFGG